MCEFFGEFPLRRGKKLFILFDVEFDFWLKVTSPSYFQLTKSWWVILQTFIFACFSFCFGVDSLFANLTFEWIDIPYPCSRSMQCNICWVVFSCSSWTSVSVCVKRSSRLFHDLFKSITYKVPGFIYSFFKSSSVMRTVCSLVTYLIWILDKMNFDILCLR